MNRLLLVAALILSLALPAAALNVYFPYKGADNGNAGVRNITLFYLAAPTVDSNAIVTIDPVRKTSGVNGSVTISNLVAGTWRGEFSYPNRPTTTNWWTWPATNGTISAADTNFLSVPTNYAGILAYSQAAADARFVQNGQTNPVLASALTISGTTNLMMVNSNVAGITTGDNTNYLIVTAAGTTAANDTYTYSRNFTDPTEGEVGVFTNSAGTYGINKSQNQENWAGLLTNAAGTTIYSTASGSIIGVWDNGFGGSGSVPLPIVAYGFTTNYQTRLVPTSPIQVPSIDTNLYVNAAIGNDAFALRGSPFFPFATLTAAAAAATNAETVFVEEGYYYWDGYWPTNASLIGRGPGVTFITNSTGTASLNVVGSGTVLANFSTIGVIIDLGGAGKYCTNVVGWNLNIKANADALVLEHFDNAKFYYSTFSSGYDTYADWTTASTNSLCEFYDCHHAATNGSIVRGLALGSATVKMYGGSIKVRGLAAFNNDHFCVGSAVATNGQAELWNVALDYDNTTTNKAVYNPSGTRVKVHGPVLPIPLDAISGVGVTYDTALLDGSALTNVISAQYVTAQILTNRFRGTNSLFYTNSVADIGHPALNNGYAGYSTNGVVAISGFANIDAGATNFQWQTIWLTNYGAGPTQVVFTASNAVMGANTFWITNQAVLSIAYYPGFGTNVVFKCLK